MMKKQMKNTMTWISLVLVLGAMTACGSNGTETIKQETAASIESVAVTETEEMTAVYRGTTNQKNIRVYNKNGKHIKSKYLQ